ncbi:MAG: hypothetical protein ACM3QS_13525, partial [Bacteroidota bacterium]
NLYVMAENASEACVAATRAPFDIFECTARKAERIETGWEESIPYNADDDRTCTEIMASEPALQSSASFLGAGAHQERTLRVPLSTAVQRFPG